MPTYEYGCKNCGHEWELEQRISANPIRKCPGCGKLKAKRLISAGNFILKGDGWYADLYSKPPSKPPPPGESAASSESVTKSESKSDAKDSKPEKKSESKKDSKKKKKKKGAA